MPNRILREGIVTSTRIDKIASDPAVEVTYRRLISIIDDYARYFANPTLVRAAIYPLCLDQYSDEEILKHLKKCQEAGLLLLYKVNGKLYLQVTDFKQRTRAKQSKFPPPPGTIDPDPEMPGWHDAHPADPQPASPLPDQARSEPTALSALEQAFHEIAAQYPNPRKVDEACRAWLTYCRNGEITEAMLPEIFEGLQYYIDSEDVAKGFITSFDTWILNKRWKDRPAPSAEAQARRRGEKKSSAGNDPLAIFEPEWQKNS